VDVATGQINAAGDAIILRVSLGELRDGARDGEARRRALAGRCGAKTLTLTLPRFAGSGT
jgi:hypothetical protein